MSPTRICFATFVFCAFLLMAQAGTWLTFNQKAPKDLLPFSMIGNDLRPFLRMCKKGIAIPRPRALSRQKLDFAEICAALSNIGER